MGLYSLLQPLSALAEGPSFSDVPSNHFAYEAVEFLKAGGIISGFSNGTFRPDQKVNRAEALKLIISPLIKPEQIEQAKPAIISLA